MVLTTAMEQVQNGIPPVRFVVPTRQEHGRRPQTNRSALDPNRSRLRGCVCRDRKQQPYE
jgi:hypothetical protein